MQDGNLAKIVELMQKNGISQIFVEGDQVRCVYQEKEARGTGLVNVPDPADMLVLSGGKCREAEIYWRKVIDGNLGQIRPSLRKGAIAKYMIATICLLTSMNFLEVPNLYSDFLKVRGEVLGTRSEAYRDFKPTAVEVLRYYHRQVIESGDYLLLGDIEEYLEDWKIKKDNERVLEERSLSFSDKADLEKAEVNTIYRSSISEKLRLLQGMEGVAV